MAAPLNVSGKRLAGKPVPVLDPVPVNAANNGTRRCSCRAEAPWCRRWRLAGPG